MINFLNFSWQDMHNSLFFLEKKSEIWKAFTLFEKWKVNLFFLSLISRVKSEMKMPWNRDREWKVKWKCLEIEIEKWNRKKILENSRETRLSQVTAPLSRKRAVGRPFASWMVRRRSLWPLQHLVVHHLHQHLLKFMWNSSVMNLMMLSTWRFILADTRGRYTMTGD